MSHRWTLLALLISTIAAVVVDYSEAAALMKRNYQLKKGGLFLDADSASFFELVRSRRLASTNDDCAPGTKLSHNQAWSKIFAAGIDIRSSSGRIGCRDSRCTSLEQVRCDTVSGIIDFKRACGCNNIVITGGTEKGHASGLKSHYKGYKLDIAVDSCVTNYIEANFQRGKPRSDGARRYYDQNRNVYALERNHWDILYLPVHDY